MARKNNIQFSVRPRYSGGSPASVNEGIAMSVAQDERCAIQAALEGTYGEEQTTRAETLGLAHIVTSLYEVRGGWDVTDFLTGETYRPSAWSGGTSGAAGCAASSSRRPTAAVCAFATTLSAGSSRLRCVAIISA